jgi:hypothetical protein
MVVVAVQGAPLPANSSSVLYCALSNLHLIYRMPLLHCSNFGWLPCLFCTSFRLYLCILCIILASRPNSVRGDGARSFWLRPMRIYSPNGKCIPKITITLPRNRCLAIRVGTHLSSSQPYAFGVSLMTVCRGTLMYGKSAWGRLWK